MPSIHVFIFALNLWLNLTPVLLVNLLPHGASAAATPVSVESLVQGERPETIASGACLERNHLSEGTSFKSGADDRGSSAIGRGPMINKVLEPKDDKSRTGIPKELKASAPSETATSSRSKNRAVKIKPRPADYQPHAPRFSQAATYTHPEVPHAQDEQLNIPYSGPDSASLSSFSPAYGYDWYAQTRGGPEEVNMQPFKWELAAFSYYQPTTVYQPVTQWGYVPVPIDSNHLAASNHPHQAATDLPSENPHRRISNIRTFAHKGESHLARKEGSFRQANAPGHAHAAGKIKKILSRTSSISPMEKGHPECASSGFLQPGNSKDFSDDKLRKRPIKTKSKEDTTHMEVSEIEDVNLKKKVGKIEEDSDAEILTSHYKEVKVMAESKEKGPMMSRSHLAIPPTEREGSSSSMDHLIEPEVSSEVERGGPTPTSSGKSISWTEVSSERDSASGTESSGDMDHLSKLGSSNKRRNELLNNLRKIQVHRKSKTVDFPSVDQLYLKGSSSKFDESIFFGKQKNIESKLEVYGVGDAEGNNEAKRAESKSNQKQNTQDSQKTDFSPEENSALTSNVSKHDFTKGDWKQKGMSKKLEEKFNHNYQADSSPVNLNPSNQDSTKLDWEHKAIRKKQKDTLIHNLESDENDDRAVRDYKSLSTSHIRNKYEPLTQNLRTDTEEVNTNSDEGSTAGKSSKEIIQEVDSQIQSKSVRFQSTLSLANTKKGSFHAELVANTESPSEKDTRNFGNSFRALANHKYPWMNVIKTNKFGILKFPFDWSKFLVSEARKKCHYILSKTQMVLNRKPDVRGDSEGMKLESLALESSKKEKEDIAASRSFSSQKGPKKNKMLNKSLNTKSDPVQDNHLNSSKKTNFLRKGDTQAQKNQQTEGLSDVSKAFSSNIKKTQYPGPQDVPAPEEKKEKVNLLKSNNFQSNHLVPGYEQKYVTLHPNLSPISLSNFQLLGKSLRADKKDWDFTIWVDFEGLSKTKQRYQMNVLQCPSTELKTHLTWIIEEIGLPEGRRRFEAIQGQIRQMQILNVWKKVIETPLNRPIQADLIQVDKILQLSRPWPTYLDSRPQDVPQLNALLTLNPKLEQALAMADKTEMKKRLRNLNTMTTRWNPHMWLTKDEIVAINQQALNLKLIFLVGDCLQFGRICFTETHIAGTIHLEEAFELISRAWDFMKTSKTPWLATPERAWLMMEPKRASLYKERLATFTAYLAEYQAPREQLIDLVDPHRKLELTGDPWWHLGHILIWQEKHLDLFTMAELGIKMKIEKGQKGISVEQVSILEASKGIPKEQKMEIIDWFNIEFNQSLKNYVNVTSWGSWKAFIERNWSDAFTNSKGKEMYLSINPEESIEFFGMDV